MHKIPYARKRKTPLISNLCHESNEPIYITKNGYGDMVLLSMETYENMFSRLKMYDAIMAGKEQADKGELIDGEEMMQTMRDKYGL